MCEPFCCVPFLMRRPPGAQPPPPLPPPHAQTQIQACVCAAVLALHHAYDRLTNGFIRRSEEVEQMSVRELRELLGSRGISTLGFLEKRDFLDVALAPVRP